MKQVFLTISGRVQGVFYRDETRQKAESLGITGWVKNEPNGNVSVMAQGGEEALSGLIDWCWDGPDSAKVDDVVEEWQAPEEEFEGFQIRY